MLATSSMTPRMLAGPLHRASLEGFTAICSALYFPYRLTLMYQSHYTRERATAEHASRAERDHPVSTASEALLLRACGVPLPRAAVIAPASASLHAHRGSRSG
jgi:hypothetical protein